MLEQLQHVFRSVFQDDTLLIQETTSANDIPMWDSLIHLELIAAIESTFKITFSFNEVMSFKNVGDLIKIMDKKLN